MKRKKKTKRFKKNKLYENFEAKTVKRKLKFIGKSCLLSERRNDSTEGFISYYINK